MAFFALTPSEQVRTLPRIPRDRGTPDFHAAFAQNPLWLATTALQSVVQHDDHVPYEAWREDVGLPSHWEQSPLPELTCLLSLLCGHTPDWQNLFSARALESKTEWRLARRLAQLVLHEFAWATTVEPSVLAIAVSQQRSNRGQ